MLKEVSALARSFPIAGRRGLASTPDSSPSIKSTLKSPPQELIRQIEDDQNGTGSIPAPPQFTFVLPERSAGLTIHLSHDEPTSFTVKLSMEKSEKERGAFVKYQDDTPTRHESIKMNHPPLFDDGPVEEASGDLPPDSWGGSHNAMEVFSNELGGNRPSQRLRGPARPKRQALKPSTNRRIREDCDPFEERYEPQHLVPFPSTPPALRGTPSSTMRGSYPRYPKRAEEFPFAPSPTTRRERVSPMTGHSVRRSNSSNSVDRLKRRKVPQAARPGPKTYSPRFYRTEQKNKCPRADFLCPLPEVGPLPGDPSNLHSSITDQEPCSSLTASMDISSQLTHSRAPNTKTWYPPGESTPGLLDPYPVPVAQITPDFSFKEQGLPHHLDTQTQSMTPMTPNITLTDLDFNTHQTPREPSDDTADGRPKRKVRFCSDTALHLYLSEHSPSSKTNRAQSRSFLGIGRRRRHKDIRHMLKNYLLCGSYGEVLNPSGLHHLESRRPRHTFGLNEVEEAHQSQEEITAPSQEEIRSPPLADTSIMSPLR